MPTATAAAPAPAAPAEPAAASARQEAPTAPVETVEAAPVAAPEPAAPVNDGKPRALTPTGSVAQAPAAEAAAPVVKAAPALAPSEPISEELSARAQAPAAEGAAPPAKVTGIPGQDQVAFRFDFDEPVAAATFRRGGAVWIVFDKPMTVDTAALKLQAGDGAIEILQIPNNDGTVLRVRTSQRFNPAVKRDGLAWIIDLAPRPMAPQAALEVNCAADLSGRSPGYSFRCRNRAGPSPLPTRTSVITLSLCRSYRWVSRSAVSIHSRNSISRWRHRV